MKARNEALPFLFSLCSRIVAPSYSNHALARSLLVFSIHDPKIKNQIPTDNYKMIVQWFK